MEKYLEKLYFNEDEPTYLGGISRVYKEAKTKFPDIKMRDVKEFMENNDTYTRHKPVRKYKALKTIAYGLDSDHQIDLADMQNVKESNNNF